MMEATRKGGIYVGCVLEGKKPDLPVMQAGEFELVLNLQTARALNLSVPTSLWAQADHVIE